MKTAIKKFIYQYRQYRGHDVSSYVVEKLWNRGNGRIELFRFYEDKKIILINASFYNKADERHLSEFINENGLSDYRIEKVEYTYPDFYRRSFGLSLINK